MYCPRCEHKICDICGNTGYWKETQGRCPTCGSFDDEAMDVCPSCKHTIPQHEEHGDKNPCVVCNYPHEFDVHKSLQGYAEDLGDRMINGEISYTQGLVALKIAAKKLKSRQQL